MSHKPYIRLQEGAILVADAHYSDKYPLFFDFLQALKNEKIKTTQLILMGDIFELLFGQIKYTIQENKKEIDILNRLSLKIEIIYFEGNHDFGLKKIFPQIKIFPLQQQPQVFEFYNQKIELSHGDTKTPFAYQAYTKTIRNPSVLSFVGILDIICSQCIIKWLKRRGENKNPCYKINNFKKIIINRLKEIESDKLDIVIEGHFHQDTRFELSGLIYINLASFSCNQKYFIVQSNKGQLHLKDVFFEESM